MGVGAGVSLVTGIQSKGRGQKLSARRVGKRVSFQVWQAGEIGWFYRRLSGRGEGRVRKGGLNSWRPYNVENRR